MLFPSKSSLVLLMAVSAARAATWDTKEDCNGLAINAGDCADPVTGTFSKQQDGSATFIGAKHGQEHTFCNLGGKGVGGAFGEEIKCNDGQQAGKAEFQLTCEHASFVKIRAEGRAEKHAVTKRSDGTEFCSGGRDDSFYAGLNKNKRWKVGISSAFVGGGPNNGVCTSSWSTQLVLPYVLDKGINTFTIEERENGAQLRSLEIIEGSQNCRFGAPGFKPKTTTAAPTPNPEVEALKKQIADLRQSSSLTEEVKKYVDAQAELVKKEAQDELNSYKAKVAKMNEEHESFEKELGKSVLSLQEDILKLQGRLTVQEKNALRAPDKITISDPTKCKQDECIPAISTSDQDMLIAASGGDVQVSTAECGKISICELRNTVKDLRAFVNALTE